MLIVESTVTLCACGDGFVVELERIRGNYEAWIHHTDCGVKLFMFGIPDESITKKEFEELVFSNIERHKKLYKREVMQEKC